MFNIRHPKPVVDSRAVAVYVVQQQVRREPGPNVLVIPAAPPAQGKPR